MSPRRIEIASWVAPSSSPPPECQMLFQFFHQLPSRRPHSSAVLLPAESRTWIPILTWFPGPRTSFREQKQRIGAPTFLRGRQAAHGQRQSKQHLQTRELQSNQSSPKINHQMLPQSCTRKPWSGATQNGRLNCLRSAYWVRRCVAREARRMYT